MSLLEDLRSLDLSDIVDARANIRAAVESPEIAEIARGGSAQTVLAGLGSSFEQIRDTYDEPKALIEPLVDAVGGLAGRLRTEDLPILEYVDAVREGATILARLFEGLDGDPSDFGKPLGISLGDILGSAKQVVDDYTHVSLDSLGPFQRLVETVERGVPTEPGAFAELAIEVLLPFPSSELKLLKTGLEEIAIGADSIRLPTGRSQGLLAALEAVTDAANTGNAATLQQALRDLERVRLHTVSAIENDLIEFAVRIERLNLDQRLAPVVRAADRLRAPGEGVLEFLERWRVLIAGARERIAGLDPALVGGMLSSVLDVLEESARAGVVESLDARIRELQEGLRGLLRHLGLRAIRGRLTSFFDSAARAIRDAELDRPAAEVREALESLRSFAAGGDLSTRVRQRLEEAERIISDALGEIVASLELIGERVNAVSGEAQTILERAAAAISDFRAALDRITTAVDRLGIEEATEQIVDALTSLRETAEEVLSVAPLPEPLRPLIEQLIDTLEGIDFDVVFTPVREALIELEIPDDVSATVNEALEEAAAALENLIPAELIASIESEVDQALGVIREFDPASLLSGVTEFLDDAAGFIEDLDPRPVVDDVRGPFQAVLDGLDRAHPRALLAPAIDAYESLLGSIPLPAPETAMEQTAEVVGSANEGIAQTVMEPIRRVAPAGAADVEESDDGRAARVTVPLPESFRPGDVVRMFAFLPNRLRETLAELDETKAGEALRAVGGFCGGLAHEARELDARFADMERRLTSGMDALLSPLGQAQLRAQLSIRAKFSGDGLDIDAALHAVAQVGPGPLRHALSAPMQRSKERARRTVADVGRLAGSSLETAADALERCTVSGLGDDLEAFLGALDPEPIAGELDALAAALFDKTSELTQEVGDEITAAVDRFKDLIEELNPGNQLQRFTAVFDVLREEMNVLDPRRLADELGEIHAALRAVVASYDPARFAEQIHEILSEIAGQLRSLDPASLLGDLSFLDDLLERVDRAVPTEALRDVGASLSEVGNQLSELDPSEMLDAVQELGPRILEGFEEAVERLRQEIVALLRAIQYVRSEASAAVRVEVA